MSRFFLPKSSGNPRYFSILPSASISSKTLTRSFATGGVRVEKDIAKFGHTHSLPRDSSVLPENVLKCCDTSSIWFAEEHGVVCKHKVIDNWTSPSTRILGKILFARASSHNAESTSVQSMNSYVDSGSPSRIPQGE